MRPCFEMGGAVAHAGLQAEVADLRGSRREAREEERGLLGVADPQLDVVDAVQRHRGRRGANGRVQRGRAGSRPWVSSLGGGPR